MQSAMWNARSCFIFSSQLHVSMHQDVDATNAGCHAYLTGFVHPTWAPGLRAKARTAAAASPSRPEPGTAPRRRRSARSQPPARTRGPAGALRASGRRLDSSGGRGGAASGHSRPRDLRQHGGAQRRPPARPRR